MRSTPPQSLLRPARPALIVAVLAGTLNNCGLVARRRGNDAQAAAFYEESLAIRRRLGDTWGIVVSLSNLGLLAYHQGDVETAVRLHLESLPLVRQLGDRVNASAALLGLAQVARAQGDLLRAVTATATVPLIQEPNGASQATGLEPAVQLVPLVAEERSVVTCRAMAAKPGCAVKACSRVRRLAPCLPSGAILAPA
jgi:hypothetical protein